MTCDPGILCFRHCSSQSIFCKTVPDRCPICQLCITSYILPPFLVPYPYKNAAHEPNSIVVRPSQGSFLNHYDNTSDLHIGIVNSKGIVCEFDKDGLVVNDSLNWTECIAYSIVPLSWEGHWDQTLETMLKHTKWKSYNYNEVTLNCFNFVIEFINNLEYMNLKFKDKEEMCEKLLLSKIEDAVAYNLLFKNVLNNKYFISKR